MLKWLLKDMKKRWEKYQKRKKAERKNFAGITTYTYYGDISEEEISALEEMVKNYREKLIGKH